MARPKKDQEFFAPNGSDMTMGEALWLTTNLARCTKLDERSVKAIEIVEALGRGSFNGTFREFKPAEIPSDKPKRIIRK